MTIDEKITKTIDSCTTAEHIDSTHKLIDNTHRVLIRKGLMSQEEADMWRNKMKSRLLEKIFKL